MASSDVRTNPQLAFIRLEVGKHSVGHAFHAVKALHDSGCSASIISKSTFDNIPDKENIKINETPSTYVVTVTGEKTPVYGSAVLYLRFTGENGTVLTLPHEVYIHDNVQYDFLLGRDFTGSNTKLFETKEHLYLTAETDDTDIEDFWERAKHTTCNVALITQKCNEKTYTVQTTCATILPPHSMTTLQCSFVDSDILPIPVTRGQPVTFEVLNVRQPRLKCPTALFTYDNPDKIIIPIYNDTFNDYIVDSYCPIAQISIWDETSVYPLNITVDNLSLIRSNHSNLQTAELIDSDENLTEEEKLDNFYEYVRTGSYSIPMTSYVESTPSVTEMSFKNTTPFSEQEFENQFHLSHLASETRHIALGIFHKHKNVFSKHDYDIGCSTDISMNIDIDESKPRIQKYVPLPHAVREPIRLIIDQMVEYGIMRECDEPSLFCSNLLVTKKKDPSQLRVLFDGRLLNNSTI